MEVTITAGTVRMSATLNDTSSAKAVWDALPLEGAANVWGDEIYFEVPVTLDEAPDARQDVAVGELAYWPPGRAFCIFFGPTPVSTGQQPRAYSPVNVFGRIGGDVAALKGIADGEDVRVERAE
ncbi:MAG: hypothetical protein GF331_09330 [Chitinivibrionales bacterium]|nr:hypothetical protein [Chitinivibrionales bacterium]